MTRLLWSLFFAVALLAQATGARADEALTQAAEREKARRTEQKASRKAKPAKRYTDEDLRALAEAAKKSQARQEGSSQEPSAAARASEEGESSDPQDDAARGFRQSVADKRKEIAGLEAGVNEIDARIAELRAERSKPTRLTEVNRDRSINNDIAAATAELEKAKTAVAEAKQQLEDLLEEARQAGVPYSQLE
jgi:chromosome segregation ATPase